MGFTPINKPRATPPILQQLDSPDVEDTTKVHHVNPSWDEPENSTPPPPAPSDRSRSKEPLPPTSVPTQPLLQSLPTRPATGDSRGPHFLPSQPTLHEQPPTQTTPARSILNESPRAHSRQIEPLSTLPAFNRGKLRPSSDVHPMTDWLRELPEDVKAGMNLGKGPNGDPVFSFREWEHQKLSSVSPYVLDKLKDAIRRDACDTSTGKRRPNADIRELLVEWDCNFDDYEDIDSWEKKHKMPVVFAWLCVRKMRVAINNKKAMWLKDLFPEESPSEVPNGTEKRPRPVSMIGAPATDLEIKRMKLEPQIPSAITTGFTSISSMPTPPNDTEPLATDRRPLEPPPR
jgi:hypothetical protein